MKTTEVTEYQRWSRLGYAEGGERKFQFGSIMLCSVIFNSLSICLLNVLFWKFCMDTDTLYRIQKFILVPSRTTSCRSQLAREFLLSLSFTAIPPPLKVGPALGKQSLIKKLGSHISFSFLWEFSNTQGKQFSPWKPKSFGLEFEVRRFLLCNLFPLFFSLHIGMLVLSNCFFHRNTQGIFSHNIPFYFIWLGSFLKGNLELVNWILVNLTYRA